VRAGDAKKFLEQAILCDRREDLDPERFDIHDNFLLGAVSAYKKGEPSEYVKMLCEAFITTETLTTQRRVAVLRMFRDVLSELAKPDLDGDTKDRLRSLLTGYFI
jgi:hypothetical protein